MNSIHQSKNDIYNEIIQHCDNLHIARYLKNEVKDALKNFHEYKLSNIKQNLDDFSEFLIFLNDENCQKIESLTINSNISRVMNNSVLYFYDNSDLTDEGFKIIKQKIESNSYEIITLMQSLKGYLILTIDEFCNASSTRIDIMRYELGKKKSKCKKDKILEK